ncbi:MAG TPA: hypothetical protein VEK73_18445 [Xanthobacteraceae bacterium]|nr:hypothetical protein [Xanthobacteraceae bacterium]
MNAVLSSLAAFLAAAVWPRTPLARAIRLVLAVKLVAILAIGILMHAASGPAVDPGAVARLVGPSAPIIESPNHGGR